MNVLIPLGGKAERFLKESGQNKEYARPKPLINILNKPMVLWALSSYPQSAISRLIFCVRKDHIENYNIDRELRSLFGSGIAIVVLAKQTEGAAHTAILGKEYINNADPLIINDCDIYFDGKSHMAAIHAHPEADGIIPSFTADDAKWSFAKLNEAGEVIRITEKNPISHHALIGAYYFKKGSDFITYAEKSMADNIRVNGEFYISTVYNYLIAAGGKVLLSRPGFFYSLGVPQDVERFTASFKLL